MDTKALQQYPFITNKILRAFLHKNHPEVTLTRWKPQLKTIEKGKYTVHENVLIYATVLVIPSYLSFLSALSYYGLTTQIPLQAQVMVAKQKRNLQTITFTTTKYFFGYTRTPIEGFDLFIAEKEKLIIDCLLYQEQGVSVRELLKIGKEDIERKKIITYLKKINKLSLIKKTGYLLEKKNIDIYPVFEKQITNNKNYPLLNSQLPAKNNINTKWRLDINEEFTT
jgi:predicted transcriptional regulator of viral defense system